MRTAHLPPIKKLGGQIPLCPTSLEPSDSLRSQASKVSLHHWRSLGPCGSRLTQLCPLSLACWKWVCFLAKLPCVLKLFSEHTLYFCSFRKLHTPWKHRFPCSPVNMWLFSFHIIFHTWFSLSLATTTSCHLFGYFLKDLFTYITGAREGQRERGRGRKRSGLYLSTGPDIGLELKTPEIMEPKSWSQNQELDA